MQVGLFHLSADKQTTDKQILEKHLSCSVKYLDEQVGHGISTGLQLGCYEELIRSDQYIYPVCRSDHLCLDSKTSLSQFMGFRDIKHICKARVKVFRIIPEFRILRLTFHD